MYKAHEFCDKETCDTDFGTRDSFEGRKELVSSVVPLKRTLSDQICGVQLSFLNKMVMCEANVYSNRHMKALDAHRPVQ